MAGPFGAADLICANGKIWTENPQHREAEAIAVIGTRIAAVGSNADVLTLRGANTEVIDLRGRRIVPGFNDAHVHFSTGGFSLTSVRLRDAKSEQEMGAALGAYARRIPKDAWILNGEWDPEAWPGGRLPTHESIDGHTPDNPVFINRVDAHTMLANGVAMRLAGVDKHTPDVPAGVIGRHPDGRPNGIFIDAAKHLIQRVVPSNTDDEMLDAIRAAQTHALSYGVTSVHDMGVPHSDETMQSKLLRAYQTLDERDELGVRVSLHTPLREWRSLARIGVMAHFGNAKLRIGGLKGFADGSLGSHTAWFFEPYDDAPATNGGPSDELVEPEEMYARMAAADRAGLQLAIHAIGDRANRTMLDFFARISDDDGVRPRRARIEHAQHVTDEDFRRFAQHEIIASVQPYHCIDDARWLEKRIGSRSRNAYAFRSLLDAGAQLAFGSDWWVAPIDPLMGIFAAVTRRTLDGAHPEGWNPSQKLTVEEAVHAYTVGSAYASFEENIKGSLEIGKMADFVVLSDDIFHINPNTIADVCVDLTVFDGRIVYAR